MKLFINGIEAYPNMSVETFRKDKAILVSWTEPRAPGSSGRVYIIFEDGRTGEYFPNVIRGKFET